MCHVVGDVSKDAARVDGKSIVIREYQMSEFVPWISEEKK
jgi:hypothetical protein